MLPPAEIRVLNRLTVLAVDMALNGYPAEGYTCLLEGSWRANDLHVAGAPWGMELTGHYREALNAYAERYSVARE